LAKSSFFDLAIDVAQATGASGVLDLAGAPARLDLGCDACGDGAAACLCDFAMSAREKPKQ
jgi:hypothetical protein